MSALHPDRDRTAGSTVSVAQYLATRLRQLGARHLFGLPGDFTLGLLDEMLTVPGVAWVGCANELNAAYVADAYARAGRGVGAVVTTYGVGELSAVNGVAGSYAEDVPVVQVTGMPSTTARAAGLLLHHTLADGDHDHFVRAYREVTAAGAVLRAATAPAQIDRVLRTALDESRPVYLGVPTDVAAARVPTAPLAVPLSRTSSDPRAVLRFRGALAAELARHPSLTVLAGHRISRLRLEGRLAAVADLPGVRVATQPGTTLPLAAQHPPILGTYLGAMTPSPDTRAAVDSAPLLVLAGAVLTDVLTGMFTHDFAPQDAVELGVDRARIGRAEFPGVHLEDALDALHDAVATRAFAAVPVTRRPPPAAVTAVGSGPLTQDRLWAEIQQWLPQDVTVIADAGTALYGALGLRLPRGCELLVQPVWSSIGYTLPATLGTSLAAPERRTVLFIGDGAAQLTAQELGTILHGGHTPVVVLLDNSGYTIERAIRSPDAVYQDITGWDWTALPAALAPGVPVVTSCVRTGEELARALVDAAGCTDRPVFIQAVLGRDDAPQLVHELARRAAAMNGAAGPGTE